MNVRRVLARAAFGVAGVLVSGVAIIMALSEARLRKTYDVPLTTIDVPRDPVSIAEGERLARIRGCYGGCHGATLEGSPFFERPGVARIPAPNLTAVLPEYSDAELARLIRRGVKRDGRSVFAMPSEMFAELTDDDLGRIIGFLRTHPGIERLSDEFRVGPLGRVGLVLGRFQPVAARVGAAPVRFAENTDPVAKGRYLARTTCTECHGRDLNGSRDGTVPDLAIAVAFPDADFLRLMREGRGLGGRELGLMGRVAQSRFAYFTDDEIGAVHEYLKHRAAHPEQEPARAAR
jgi:mono/diheme cytochrome c family protein